jgi:hypothetical protein
MHKKSMHATCVSSLTNNYAFLRQGNRRDQRCRTRGFHTASPVTFVAYIMRALLASSHQPLSLNCVFGFQSSSFPLALFVLTINMSRTPKEQLNSCRCDSLIGRPGGNVHAAHAYDIRVRSHYPPRLRCAQFSGAGYHVLLPPPCPPRRALRQCGNRVNVKQSQLHRWLRNQCMHLV